MSCPTALSVRPASLADKDTVSRLFADAHLRIVFFDWEEWKQPAAPFLTLLADDDHDQTWGAIVLQVESRPATMPAGWPCRVYVRGLAVARGRNSRDDVSSLLVHTRGYLHHQHTAGLLILMTDRTWLHKAAGRAAFQHVDSLRYMHRNLRIRDGGNPDGIVRLAQDADYRELACRDAETFGPLWHMGESDLRRQAQTGCLLVQQINSVLAGFILFEKPQSIFRPAFVTRLAVWPEWQGCKIGSHLLMCAISQLPRGSLDRVGLNVLESNTSARKFYTYHGFRSLGRPLAVFTCLLGDSSPLE